MIHDQERDFKDACTRNEVLTAREYLLGSLGDYLGELRTTELLGCSAKKNWIMES